jgi:hypothetical protein
MTGLLSCAIGFGAWNVLSKNGNHTQELPPGRSPNWLFDSASASRYTDRKHKLGRGDRP